MSILDYLKEIVEATPGSSNNYKYGNVSNKGPVITKVPDVIKDDDESLTVDKLIQDNNISIDKSNVETIIALVYKTLDDYNREKKLNGKEIETIVVSAIEMGLIEVK